MIAAVCTYGLLVSLLFSAAAWTADRYLGFLGGPRRFTWAVSMLASVLLPTLSVLTAPPAAQSLPRTSTHQIAHSSGFATGPIGTTSAKGPAPALEPTIAHDQPTLLASSREPAFDEILQFAWVSCSVGLLCFYLVVWLGLRRMARRWSVSVVAGVSVRVSESMPPAVVGYLKPQVVIPRWMLFAPLPLQKMVLAHEREHIAAGDPLLLLGMLLLLVLAPWNLPMWWQLRRLRFALEVDCDARVLRAGTERQAYAQMLLVVSQRRAWLPIGVPSMGGSVSVLEKRMRLFLSETRRPSKALTAAIGALSLSFVVMAAELSAPPVGSVQLRKLPPRDVTPGAQWARDTARARFPELFDTGFDGTAVISQVFNANGSVLMARYVMFPPGTTPTGLDSTRAAEAAGAEPQDVAYGSEEKWAAIGPWLGSKNSGRIEFVYAVLKWPIDTTRSAARVRSAVQKSHPELLQPRPDAQTQSLLTVLMNDDGSVGRLWTESIGPGSALSVGLDSLERFTALGVGAEEIGRRGVTFSGSAQISYAWPRRPDDEPFDVRSHQLARLPQPDDTDDAALVAHYFPRGLANPLPVGGQRWILFGRDGRVWGTGQGVYKYGRLLQNEIEARFPGIKVTDAWMNASVNCLGATVSERERLRISCFWLTADSPVNEPANVDMSRRPAVFVAAELFADPAAASGAGVPLPVSVQFGQVAVPAGDACQPQVRLPACDLEFIARPAGADHVELTLRLPVRMSANASLGNATVQLAYGEMKTVRLVDSERRTWKVSVRPLRLD